MNKLLSTDKLPQKPTFKATAKKSENQKLNFGQKLADAMASKVGSWSFLIGQTTILVGWVGVNLAPGLPHWDESPFILLNLVFSFASAYTAPIVLMSQNRQSDEDRKHASDNHNVNLQTSYSVELLHQKMDEVYSQKFSEMMEMLKQQQQTTEEVKVVFLPSEVKSTAKNNKPGELAQETGLLPSLQLPRYVGLIPTNKVQQKK